jgi:hypothetical protein
MGDEQLIEKLKIAGYQPVFSRNLDRWLSMNPMDGVTEDLLSREKRVGTIGMRIGLARVPIIKEEMHKLGYGVWREVRGDSLTSKRDVASSKFGKDNILFMSYDELTGLPPEVAMETSGCNGHGHGYIYVKKEALKANKKKCMFGKV